MTGSGTLLDPYVIWDINDLQSLRTRDAAYYKLGQDIDASATPAWFGGMGFEPVNWPFPQRRFPTGDFSSTGAWTVFPAVPATMFDKVNEIDPDGDIGYIRYGGGVATILFNSGNFNIPIGSSISRLQVWFVCRDEGGPGTNEWWGYVRVGGVDYQSTWTTLGGSGASYKITNFAREFITNPATGLPWTVDDINGVGPNPLQAWGFRVSGTRTWRFTQVYALVELDDCPIQYKFDGNGHKISDLFIDRRTDALYIYAGYDVAVFQNTLSSEIKDLILENTIIQGKGHVGSIVGFVSGSNFKMSNCHASGDILGTDSVVGGLIGDMYLNAGEITNCSFNGSVHGDYTVSGLVGRLWNDSIVQTVIRNSKFNGQVTQDTPFFGRVGGLVGYGVGFDVISCLIEGIIIGGNSSGGIAGAGERFNIQDSKVFATVSADPTTGDYFGGLVGITTAPFLILRCQMTGNVTSLSGFMVGGLVGYADIGAIEESFATGDLIGDDRVGGLVGFSDARVKNCYALGNVTAATMRAGGLVGVHDAAFDMENSYSIGLVQSPALAGGLIGEDWGGGGAIVGCFWNIQTSGQTTSAGGTGKTTAEMKSLATFLNAGWDIMARTIDKNNGYPYLAWQSTWYILVTPTPAPISVVTLAATEIR